MLTFHNKDSVKELVFFYWNKLTVKMSHAGFFYGKLLWFYNDQALVRHRLLS